ncbi:MAG: hypothetical protein ACOVOR_00825 [Rhabdochlamydiaceae bacterium]
MSFFSCWIPRYQSNEQSVLPRHISYRHKGLDFLLNTYVAKSLLKPWLSSKNIYDLLIAYHHNDLFLTIKRLADIYEWRVINATIRKNKYLDGIYDLNVSGQLEISLTEMELRALKIDKMEELSIQGFINFSSFNFSSRSLKKLELDCQEIQDDYIDVFDHLPQASDLFSLSVKGLSDEETVQLIEKVSLLSRLTEFKLTSLIGEKQIATLLQSCPCLKSISLKTKTSLTQITELIPHQTAQKYETISLEVEKTTFLEAVKLLKKVSLLKTLELISDFECSSSSHDGYFHNLDKLILERSNKAQDVSQILDLVTFCPNLSHIGLKSFSAGNMFFDPFQGRTYPRLKTIDMYRTNLKNGENLWMLAPSLSSLHLYVYTHGGMISRSEPDSFNRLTHFSSTILGLKIHSLFDRDVIKILESARFLSSLQIHNERFENESDFFLGLKEKSLPCLKEVSLSGSQISPRSIQFLLKAAVNIRLLDLTGCKRYDQIHPTKNSLMLLGCTEIKGAFDSLQTNELLNLEQVYLNRFSGIDKQDLEKLMKGAPHLQGIFLRINKDFMNILPQLESGQFISLKSFCEPPLNKHTSNNLENKQAKNRLRLIIEKNIKKNIWGRMKDWFSSISH